MSSLNDSCINKEGLELGNFLSPLAGQGVDIDTMVLISLLFQFVLVIVAPWRKRARDYLTPVIGFVYLESEALINYALGLLPNKNAQGGRTSSLRVFWAPFFLLHLGNPNTISALSLRDSELWLRYASHIVTISYTFGRVFLHHFFPHNGLWIPTLLVYLAGLLKYGERIICLNRSRITKFRESALPKPDPGENYARLMKTHAAFQRSKQPGALEFRMSEADQVRFGNKRASSSTDKKLSQVRIVKEAYRLFQDFRGLFVDSVYAYDKRDISRYFFLNRVADAEDAFSVCEVELNFAYDVFYTKAMFINKSKWPLVNLATFLLQLVSFVLWFRMEKCHFHRTSFYVTEVLVYGSLALDLISLIIFFTSDWSVASNSFFFCEKLLLFKKLVHQMYRRGYLGPVNLFGRWSERIPQKNFIDSSVNTLFSDRIPVVWFTEKHKNFIFEEVVARSCWAQTPADVEQLSSARGMWVLNRLSLKYNDKDLDVGELFGPWIADVEYKESLIIWHIATTLCYVLEPDPNSDSNCELSNTLSEYMLHILVGPSSQEITGHLIYRDTCAEADVFFKRVLPTSKWPCADKKKRVRTACEKLLQVNTDVVSPKQIRGNESKSVLFDACILAKKLRGLEKIIKWEIISRVWAEMLFFSATESYPTDHLEKLSEGGDLLTLVWLLMAHLGLGNHFRYNKAKETRAQLKSSSMVSS